MKLKLLGMDPSFSSWGLAAMLYDTEARSLSVAKLDVIQPPKDNSKQVRKSSQDQHDPKSTKHRSCVYADSAMRA